MKRHHLAKQGPCSLLFAHDRNQRQGFEPPFVMPQSRVDEGGSQRRAKPYPVYIGVFVVDVMEPWTRQTVRTPGRARWEPLHAGTGERARVTPGWVELRGTELCSGDKLHDTSVTDMR